jgi:hypothetical protein
LGRRLRRVSDGRRRAPAAATSAASGGTLPAHRCRCPTLRSPLCCFSAAAPRLFSICTALSSVQQSDWS